MKTILGLFAAAALLVGLAAPAAAQAPPPGSYRESCRDIRTQGPNLTALCRTKRGREQVTALNVEHCVGDIGNNNGNLVCNGGRPAAPAPPPGPPPPPGYPAPGYAPPPRYSEEHCEHLRHEEHELRDRLASTPYGEERERLEYRLGQIHSEREQCFRR
jgi:CVNH domain